jgi:hypothetical protein
MFTARDVRHVLDAQTYSYPPFPLGYLMTIYQQQRLCKRSNDDHFEIKTTGK